MRSSTQHEIRLGGRTVAYRLVCSKSARKLRVRVGPNGVDVVQPAARNGDDVSTFLERNKPWLLDQLERVDRLRGVRTATQHRVGEIHFRGERTRLRIETSDSRVRGNTVHYADGEIVVLRGSGSLTPVAKSLETWLRKVARAEIERQLSAITARLRQRPGRLYVMSQRTKWGNCSATRNLSFNWRLILAPDFVLRYLVTHEAVHLAIPDHSAKFWLTVRSLCRETERARQWLCAHTSQLRVDLGVTCAL